MKISSGIHWFIENVQRACFVSSSWFSCTFSRICGIFMCIPIHIHFEYEKKANAFRWMFIGNQSSRWNCMHELSTPVFPLGDLTHSSCVALFSSIARALVFVFFFSLSRITNSLTPSIFMFTCIERTRSEPFVPSSRLHFYFSSSMLFPTIYLSGVHF